MKIPMLPILASVAAPVAQVAAQWLLNQFPPPPKSGGDHGMGAEPRPSLSGVLEFWETEGKLYASNKLNGAAMVSLQKEETFDGACSTSAVNLEIPRGKAARIDPFLSDYSQIGQIGVIQASSPLGSNAGDPKLQIFKSLPKWVGLMMLIGGGAEMGRGTRNNESYFFIRSTNMLETLRAMFKDSTGQTTEINATLRPTPESGVGGMIEYRIPVEPWVASDVLNDFSLTITGPAPSIRSLAATAELRDFNDFPEPIRSHLLADLAQYG